MGLTQLISLETQMTDKRELETGSVNSSLTAPDDRSSVHLHGMGLFYDVHVFCCVNERPPKHRRGCCASKGSRLLCDYMCRRSIVLGLRQVRVNHAGCLNRCELGPTMVIYPEGVWYTFSTEVDIDEIIACHIARGVIVERLLIRPEEGPRH
jgi:(2Fe-2S) ferredoxin